MVAAAGEGRGRFESDGSIDRTVTKLFDRSASMERDGIMTYDWIKQVGRIERGDRSWNSVVKKLRRRFRKERGITLVCEANVGFRLASTDDQLHVCPERDSLRGMRALRRAAEHAESLPDHELTPHQRTTKNSVVQHNKRARRAILRARREDAALFKTPKPDDRKRRQDDDD